MTERTLKLSVLDLFPVGAGVTASQAIRDGVRVAQAADALGYVRYWIAEHHNLRGIASSAPEILIGHVASQTKRILVGAGGIMVPNHAPLHVVEVFRTLAALHPGRIELGLGRAPGTDPRTSSALRRGPDEVNEQLAELIAFAEHGFPPNHPYAPIVAMPDDVPMPALWMLGSTQTGAAIAAELGVGFAFAGHFAMAEADAAMARYRRTFRKSARAPGRPYAILALSVICAPTEARARELALPLRVAFARMGQGRPAAFPSLEEARAHTFTAAEEAFVERMAAGLVVGTPDQVHAQLTTFAAELAADEIMLSTVILDVEERIASYELVAKRFGLAA